MLFFIALGFGLSAPAAALPKRDRGEPPPLRAADLLPKNQSAKQEIDAVDAALMNAEQKPAPAETTPKPAQDGSPPLTCQAEPPGPKSSEAKVVCSDGKSFTMRSAGLMLPTNLRCTNEHPECCQIGYRNLGELQIADLLRVARGQPPVCHVRVEEVKTYPPVVAPPVDLEEDTPTLGLPSSQGGRCPDGLYLLSGRCYDTRELMRALKPKAFDDPNRGVFPDVAAVVARLRQEFDATGRCPKSADNALLLRLDDQARLRAADAPLDVTPLIAKPETPGLARPEPQLPTVCSYYGAKRGWQETSYYCETQNLCFAQSQGTLPHNCIRFERATARGPRSPSFFPRSHCQGLPSCFDSPNGECAGTARLVALGSGVFLISQEDARQARDEFGILFSRRRTRSPAELAVSREARTILLQIGRTYLSGVERERFHALIDAQPE